MLTYNQKPLTYNQKRIIELEIVNVINQKPNGINTRKLISQVLNNVSASIPNANRHHISGMIAWVLKVNNYNFSFLIRTPGYSVIHKKSN